MILVSLQIVVLLLVLQLLLPALFMILAICYEVVHFVAIAGRLPTLSVHVMPVTVLLHVSWPKRVPMETAGLLGRLQLYESGALITGHIGT